MSGKQSRQVRKEISFQTDRAKSLIALQILDFMCETAQEKTFFQRLKICMRYLFKKDFRGLLGED
jgi:hypothetical protein